MLAQDEEAEEGETHALVEAVDRMAAEKKLSVNGLALYHLVAPMFPGQGFQVLRQRYLKYQSTTKQAVDEERPNQDITPPSDTREDEESPVSMTERETERRENNDPTILPDSSDKDGQPLSMVSGDEPQGQQPEPVESAELPAIRAQEETVLETNPSTLHTVRAQEETVLETNPSTLHTVRAQEETVLETDPSTLHTVRAQEETVLETDPSTLHTIRAQEETVLETNPSTLHESQQQDLVGIDEVAPTTCLDVKFPKEEPPLGRQTARKIPRNRDNEVIVEITKVGPRTKPNGTDGSQDQQSPTLQTASPDAEQKELIYGIIEEMMVLHKVPHEVILYALLMHSGDVVQASNYLADMSRTPQWDFQDDLAILEEDAETRLPPKRSLAEIASRREFLTRLCELPQQ